jgi:hypothetical protein
LAGDKVELVLNLLRVVFTGARATGRVTTCVQASLLTWLLSSAIGLAALWIVTFAAMDTIARNGGMQQDLARSGARDVRAFIVDDALGATVIGTAAALVVGTSCGAAGALLAKARRPLPPRPAAP